MVTYVLSKCADIARCHIAGLPPRATRRRERRLIDLRVKVEVIIIIERVGIRPPKRKLPRLRVLDPEVLPVQQRRQSLDAVALVDPLAPCLHREREHEVRELVDGVFDGAHAPVDDVAPLVVGVVEHVFHEGAEAGEVGRD